MHPDAIIAGLRRELDRLRPDDENYSERKKAIEAEIVRADGLERPEATPEQPETVVNHNVSYLAGLKRELERAEEHAKDAVLEEIRRVEKLIHKEATVESEQPSAEEIEQRKQARAGRKVERAVNPPGGREAPASAPESAEKE